MAMRRDIDAIRTDLVQAHKLIVGLGPELRGHVTRSAEDVVNASCIQALGFDYPVFLGGPSIDAQHARLLLFILQERKPRTVLELGSGSSTAIVARALERLGVPARIHIAVDHEARFLRNTEEIARMCGVADRVRFEHCPLAPIDGYALPWYSRIPQLVAEERLDLVIVDGPPAYSTAQGRAREPALPVLRPFLSDNAVIILDDANRPGEADTIEAWKRQFPEFNVQIFAAGKGVAVLSLGIPI